VTTQTTTYYLAYTDENAPRDKPRGLYRRVFENGRVVASEAYHPRTGWHQTDYWLRLTSKGEGGKHLVEVDEAQALHTQEAALALYRSRNADDDLRDQAGPSGQQ
jgi:hypothetical protein